MDYQPCQQPIKTWTTTAGHHISRAVSPTADFRTPHLGRPAYQADCRTWQCDDNDSLMHKGASIKHPPCPPTGYRRAKPTMPSPSPRWLLALLVPVLPAMWIRNDTSFQSTLSKNATLLHPNTPAFAAATQRWSAVDAPSYSVIVQVATEADVQKTIKHANRANKPFLAISGGHGQTTSVGGMRDGIGISLAQLDRISIAIDGHSVTIGGGVQNDDLIAALAARGKQTVTTGCDCVGIIAPVLGGGHGWLQGRYGLLADQLLAARMVLANGTAVNVSEDENPDLLWALRGAGHNFGVVTKAQLRIYDTGPEGGEWTASGFVFTQDRLEALFAVANGLLDDPKRPDTLTYYFVAMFDPTVDEHHPILTAWVMYEGRSIPDAYTAPLHALHPISVKTTTSSLANLNIHLGATRDGPACSKGFARALSPVSLLKYNIPALRAAFTIFGALPAALHAGSVFFFESYPTGAVRAVPENSTAYPDRAGALLVSPLLGYAVGEGAAHEELKAVAAQAMTRIRDVLVTGSGAPLVAYVNYARGDESVEDVYGAGWRVERLRALKREVDPEGRFGWYAPIS
ncbi:hypothetical protein C7974DRAFT_393811 [Boeremia exigua]|uniref:uncharacterized protein n=1 Tax=Boeremia exigua TaxID=749465 RepID=UPI001E8E095A|nr:uncharacterized protein C7974DRAFT_393811 [Boeremia exigua]KAH6629086.1 hypothetical protein C7974DRAFT_393811 [Boeremia exigua]